MSSLYEVKCGMQLAGFAVVPLYRDGIRARTSIRRLLDVLSTVYYDTIRYEMLF